jgi:hypothetical protein
MVVQKEIALLFIFHKQKEHFPLTFKVQKDVVLLRRAAIGIIASQKAQQLAHVQLARLPTVPSFSYLQIILQIYAFQSCTFPS